MLRSNPARLNKLATLAVIPVLAFGIALAERSRDSSAPAEPPDLSAEGTLVVANLQSHTLAFYELGVERPPQTLALPGPPHEIARLGDRLYVTLGRADLLVEVDPFAPAILRSVPLPGTPHGIAIDSHGIHIALDDAGEIVTLDWSTLEVLDRHPTGDTPHVVMASHGALFVTDSRDDRLRRIAADGVLTAATAALPEAMAIWDGLVITGDADASRLSVFDAATLAPVTIVELPGRPVRLLVHGDRLVISLNHAATVAVLDLPSFTERAVVSTGAFPDGICASPSSQFIAVPSNGDGRVTIIGTRDWKSLGNLQARPGTGACAWITPD